MQIKLANPRGFCAGVDRAIDIVNRALDMFGAPIYVRHEVVHNKYVVDELRERGAVFVEEVEDVPADSLVIFSAHGVSQEVRREADKRGLKIFDATCPLVTKVHLQVAKFSDTEQECILIGHAGHPEVEGTLGQYESNGGGNMYLIERVEDVERLEVQHPEKLAFVTQTTLSVDETRDIIAALQQKFPAIVAPRKDDICYATQNRQDAVKSLATECDLLLVVGSPNSSNSNRLKELSERLGTPSYLIDGAAGIEPKWLEGKSAVGVTAGASAPEILVQEVVSKLQALGGEVAIESQGVEENVTFSLPRELRLTPAN